MLGRCRRSPVVVLLLSFAVAPLRRRGAAPRAEAAARDASPTGGAGFIQHHPWPGASSASSILVSSPSRLRPAARLLRRGQLPGGHHHPAGLRPAGRRASAPASTGRSCSPPRSRPAPIPHRSKAVTGGLRRRPRRRVRHARRSPTTRRRPRRRCGRLIPTTAPQDEATTELVDRLRDDVLPPATEGTGLDVAVTGSVAAGVDFSEYLAERLPVVLRRRARRCRSCC